MKKLIAFIILIIFSRLVYSQCGWACTYPYPTIVNLYSVAVLNSSTAVAVGFEGTILKTSNGGINWMSYFDCSTDKYFAVQFIDQNTGYIVGSGPSSGVILKTTNQGINWLRTDLNEVSSITRVFFRDVNSGYICGNGSILKTTNGGGNWVICSNGFDIDFKSLYFANDLIGYTSGNYSHNFKIYKTINGGYNWNAIVDNADCGIVVCYFINANTGFFSGSSVLYPNYPFFSKTTNGGMNWYSPVAPNRRLSSMYFVNSTSGFACYDGYVFRSTDTGETWTTSFQNSNLKCNSMHLAQQGFGICAGNYGSIIKTTDLGTSWSFSSQENKYGFLRVIRFVNSQIGYAVCGYGIFKSTNGGGSWFLVYLPSQQGFTDLSAPDENAVYVCAGNRILKSTDGGGNWINLYLSTNSYFNAISFLNSNTGFCSGCYNITNSLLKTTNGGVNWVNQDFGFCAKKGGDIVIADSNTIYINAVDLRKSTDGGASWDILSNPGATVRNLYFFNSLTGFAAGNGIFVTSNGGINWLQKSNSTSLDAISFYNNNIGIVVGGAGKIMKTTNHGDNWILISSPTMGNIVSVELTDTNIIHIGVSEGPVIYRSTNGGSPFGLHESANLIPAAFFLHQNYPNPFNPTTKIRFDIPAASPLERAGVRLVIYDLLGREVATLVNEQLSPGTYEVEWNPEVSGRGGSAFASGVYFYSLITKDFSQTRKLILLK